MRIVFDKEYDIPNGLYQVKVRELEFDEELQNVLNGIDPAVKIEENDVPLSELKERVFELQSRDEAEKLMGEIRGALVEALSGIIARFKEAQSFNGSVSYEIDFNEL
ncbi:hypothetical protein [Thermococcus sp. Bubb.Bath]|uniref:hypothetical protein n=1 Tax=Thermococcus sp. Bubb.Bath TaxID=1638242 RepID=UPI00197ED220|nr:hypothetical protein [Thermococcus sp. Bubb.Bath]